MRIIRTRVALTAALTGILLGVAFVSLVRVTQVLPVSVSNLPKELTDSEFWKMVDDFSEPGGYFRSDNFVSNERDFQYVLSDLKKNRAPGGVYLGVGPDQNFTYIVALQPGIAFIVDIRRQNLIEHLMYKALLELSSDRADFLSRLFSRKQPMGLGADDTANTLLAAYMRTNPDRKLFDENLKSIVDVLTVRHGFKLTAEDIQSLNYVYTAFFESGPDLTYNFKAGDRAGQGGFGGYGGFRGGYGGSFGGPRGMPTYAQLMVATDQEGHNRSYLGSKENFRILQDLERKNLVVPLVGDFAGARTLRAVGSYLKDHSATVTAFYTSNVEQYLFQQDDDWSRFYSNVAMLPTDSNSTFIRSVANRRYSSTPGARASLLCPIPDLLKPFNAGRLHTYPEVIAMSR